jgi:Holliday junction DNA helicase RuvA
MIALLEGELAATGPDWVIISAGGIGFRVHVPLSTRGKLPEIGERCRLHTRMVWREDNVFLCGFAAAAEADVFDLLTKVSGVGPKLAMSILSHSSPRSVLEALALQDAEAFRRMPGIGRKTAERLILELKDKVSIGPDYGLRAAGAGEAAADRLGQAVQALQSLGYSHAEAVAAVEAAGAGEGTGGPEELIRRALKRLAGG